MLESASSSSQPSSLARPAPVATRAPPHSCDNRSTRRPSDGKRQPVLRVMPSSTKPESVVIGTVTAQVEPGQGASGIDKASRRKHRV